jgi:hypothetical protein
MQAGPISGINRRSKRSALAIWIALAGTYMVFAGSVSVNEGLAALGCAGVAALWWWAVGRRNGRFQFDLNALRPLGPAVVSMPRKAAGVGLHMAKTLRGRAEGGVTRERSASEITGATPSRATAPAARAVGLLAASLAPDSYVLTLDRRHGTVAMHVLEDDAR